MFRFYFKFLVCLTFMLVTLGGYLLGGSFMWSGFVFVLFVGFVADGIFKSDTSFFPPEAPVWFFNLLLYLHLPIVVIINLVFAWHLGDMDPMGLGAFFQNYLAWDILSNKAQTDSMDLLGGVMTMGFVYGVASTNVAHELVHRVRHKPSITVGRFLLGFTLDTSFSIEHVFGHHRHVSTLEDPSSAKRGESSWFFLYRSTKDSLISAWNIEKKRLSSKKQKLFSPHNVFIRGQFISLLYALMYYAIAQEKGLLIFLLMAIYGKAYLEFINYIEHYGIVRVPNSRVDLRHSWNSNHSMSSYLLYNLPRHAHHHIISAAPFWKIKACPEAPSLPHGYLYMIFFSMFPPIYNRIMIPRIKNWDLNYADAHEKRLAQDANDKAGWSNAYLEA